MEGFLEALGATALIILIVVGAVAGLIAGFVAGRDKLLYMVLGIVGAVALPFILAALGITVLAAGGILALIVVAVIGAIILLLIGRAIFGGKRREP